MTWKSFYTSGLTGARVTRKELTVNGIEQLTVFVRQCCVLSLSDYELLSGDVL